jgi:hypothetical protein
MIRLLLVVALLASSCALAYPPGGGKARNEAVPAYKGEIDYLLQVEPLTRECRPPGYVIATGPVVRTGDGSDYFYIGQGLTLSGPPASNAVTRLGSLAISGKAYQVILVEVKE